MTSISGWFSTTFGLNLPVTAIHLTGRMYVSYNGQSVPTPLAGSNCTATPALTGPVGIGTISEFTCSGLSLPITQGSIGFFGLQAQTAGLPMSTSVPLQGSMSVEIS